MGIWGATTEAASPIRVSFCIGIETVTLVGNGIVTFTTMLPTATSTLVFVQLFEDQAAISVDEPLETTAIFCCDALTIE